MHTEKYNQKVLEWDVDISVNDPVIDSQHNDLLKQIGVLSFSLMAGDATNKIQDTIEFLDKYIEDHLDYEEKYMLKNEYPDFEHHKKIHDFARNSMIDFKNRVSNEDEDKEKLIKDIEKHLREWWLDHITVTDKKYAAFIEEKEKQKINI